MKDEILNLKIIGGKLLIKIKKLEEHRDNQLEILARQTLQSEILDQHRILQAWDEMIREASLELELTNIKIKKLQPIAA